MRKTKFITIIFLSLIFLGACDSGEKDLLTPKLYFEKEE